MWLTSSVIGNVVFRVVHALCSPISEVLGALSADLLSLSKMHSPWIFSFLLIFRVAVTPVRGQLDPLATLPICAVSMFRF
jgi:hypothetical protein